MQEGFPPRSRSNCEAKFLGGRRSSNLRTLYELVVALLIASLLTTYARTYICVMLCMIGVSPTLVSWCGIVNYICYVSVFWYVPDPIGVSVCLC